MGRKKQQPKKPFVPTLEVHEQHNRTAVIKTEIEVTSLARRREDKNVTVTIRENEDHPPFSGKYQHSAEIPPDLLQQALDAVTREDF